MSKTLNITDDLKLPLDLAAQAIVEVGIRGSGKTNTARALAEELLKAGVPICVIDPTDAWWGLRSSRDCKGSGFPVTIFGGEHGDLPLEESHGKIIAEFLVAERVPVILSLRHLRKSAQRRFVTQLCEELYHLKGKPENRSPLTVFIDESPLFIPQQVQGDVAQTVGAVEDMVNRGRNVGFGVVLISQRFATINKNVSTQADTIICHRLTSPQDRKALAEWIENNATISEVRETLASLATLKNGEAWLWAPSIDLYRRVQIRLSETFDSGATPKMGVKPVTPKKLAEIDRDKLKVRMAAAVEQKKTNDPAELKKKIAELQKQLSATASAKPAKEITKSVEKPVIKDVQIARMEKVHERTDERVKAAMERIAAIVNPLSELLHKENDETRLLVSLARTITDARAPAVPAPSRAITTPHVHQSVQAATVRRGNKKSQQDRILGALRWWESLGVTSPTVAQLAPIADYAPSGSFDTYLSRLGSAGLLERAAGKVTLLPQGAAITPAMTSPPTLASLHATVLATLDGPQTKIISALLSFRGKSVSVADLASASEYAASGSFDTYLSRLGSRGLIVRAKGLVTPTDVLFPEGLS